MVITEEKLGCGEVEEGKGGINSNGRRRLGVGNNIQLCIIEWYT